MAIITEPNHEAVLAATDVVTPLTPLGPRVSWSGVISGLFVSMGTLMILTTLGLAIGITALGDPRAATGDTASGLGMGAGVWALITLLVAFFLGGMISTQVTDRPDRSAAVIHGVLVWVLFMLVLFWLMVSGISLGLTGLFSTIRTFAQGATAAGIGTIEAGGDLTRHLGLENPDQILLKLEDPRTASVLATATGMSPEEATAALSELRSRVEAVKDDPARLAADVRNYLGQYTERAKQQAMAVAAAAQRGATIGSWISFGVMLVTLGVAIAGAISGVPSLQQWRQALVRFRG